MLTVEEIQKDIAAYQKRLANPAGLSEQQIAVYCQAIVEATSMLQQMQAAQRGPVTPAPTPPPTETYKRTAPPPPVILSEAKELHKPSPPPSPSPTPSPLEGGEQPVTVRTPGAQQTPRAIPATIHVDHDADPYNPVVKIVWDDGYTFSGDESTIRAQFLSRLQNCAELKDAKDPHRRQKKMWRWDTPWRCLGLLQALIYFNAGQAPTLTGLGVNRNRVSNLFVELFQFITHTALSADTPAKADTKP